MGDGVERNIRVRQGCLRLKCEIHASSDYVILALTIARLNQFCEQTCHGGVIVRGMDSFLGP